MEIFENKKIGLIVTIVLSVGGMIALMACFAPQSGPSNYITGAVMGGISLLAQIFFFIAFRMLGEKESRLIGLVRWILVIIGGAFVLIFAGIGTLLCLGTGAEVLRESPWIVAFGSCWLLMGSLSFHFFYTAADNFWDDEWYPFLGLISAAISYAICVGCGYLGGLWGEFFVVGLPVLLGLAAFVFAVVRVFKGGSPFEGAFTRGLSGGAAESGTSAEESCLKGGSSMEYGDTRPKGSEWKFCSMINDELHRISGERWGYGYAMPGYLGAELAFGTIRVKGTIEVNAEYSSSGFANSTYEFESALRSIAETFGQKISAAVSRGVEAFRRNYSGFDDSFRIDLNGVKFEPRG